MTKIIFHLKQKKRKFFYNKIELLGYKISINGIQPLNINTKAITEFNTPKTIKDDHLSVCVLTVENILKILQK